MRLMAPVAKALPESVPAENLIALLLVLLVCFLVGIAIRTRTGTGDQESRGQVFISEDSGLLTFAKFYATTGGEYEGPGMECGAG